MQNVKFIDNQWVTRYVVQMWFKFFGNNFHVAGTKTDFVFLRWDLRKLAQARFQRYEKWRKPPSGKSLFLVKRESIIAASSESVSTQYSQPITALIRDCTYRYSQYNISSTFGYTIPVLVTLCFFWLEFFVEIVVCIPIVKAEILTEVFWPRRFIDVKELCRLLYVWNHS